MTSTLAQPLYRRSVSIMRHPVLLLIVRRLLALVVLLIIVSFAIFSLLYISPGNVVDSLLRFRIHTPAMEQAMRHEYHLDQPFLVQYWYWLRDAAQFKFGSSSYSKLPVAEEIRARFPISVFLGLFAYVLVMLFGVCAGLVAAFRRDSLIDRLVVGVAIAAFCAPVFVTGIFLIYFFAILVHWFPAFGQGSGFFDELWHLTLPAIALASGAIAVIAKHTRASVIGVLDQDYIVFARARGLSKRRVFFRYVLRNALIPVVTVSGVVLAGMIVGAVIVEQTFSISGVGSLLVNAAEVKDVTMIQGVAIVVAVVIMLANLVADLIYMAIDPRIRLVKR